DTLTDGSFIPLSWTFQNYIDIFQTTDFLRALLKGYATSVTWILALALHPTPAICGVPTESARALIGELEPFDRGFYTGLVGWTDASGDGEWAIALRCGVVDAASVRLYAGAGIVAGSDPERELAETTAKFRTFLQGLGDLT
ncbi:chorismate-binding protein, partial [Kibdelosporangium lantanae]